MKYLLQIKEFGEDDWKNVLNINQLVLGKIILAILKEDQTVNEYRIYDPNSTAKWG